MTMCIGAMAWDRETNTDCVVLCFDSKVSTDEFGSETEHKFYTLSDQLVALWADSAARAKELCAIYREHLKHTGLSVNDAVEQLREPIRVMKRRLASAYIGRRLGLTYGELMALGTDLQQRYLANIDEHPVRADLVIGGFIGRKALLCELRSDELSWCTNYAMIGTGTHIAEPAMHARGHERNTPLSEALYNVYEAKRLAEASPFVGQRTKIFILEPPESGSTRMRVLYVTPEGHNALNRLFKRYGPKPMVKIPQLPTNALAEGLWPTDSEEQ